MKTIQPILTLFAVISLTLTSCAQEISGNGDVVQQDRPIEPFSEIKIGGVLSVHLKQGDTESLMVEADENLLDLIETENQGNTLVIGLRKGVELKKAEQKDVYITLRNLDKLTVGGVVSVEGTTPIETDELELEIGGVSQTDLELYCDQLTANADMVGGLTLRGEAHEATIENGGVGSLKAFDLKVDNLTIKNSGVGSAEVQAQDEISITSSGVGSVRYKGDAVVKELNTSGIGKVKKI